MADPTTGYNGRTLKIKFDGEVIAAVQSRELKYKRESVEVTNDDSDGFQRFLSEPGKKGLDLSIEGVATIDNYNLLIDKWNGTTYENVTIEHPNGTEVSAADGFLLADLSHKGEHDKHVAFSASLSSSGPISVVYAGSTT